MSQTESLSSVFNEVDPERLPGTLIFRKKSVKIIEPQADRRIAGTSVKSRLIHIREENSLTTLLLTPEQNHSSFHIGYDYAPFSHLIEVNGSHIRISESTQEGKTSSSKYILSGKRVEDDEIGLQMQMWGEFIQPNPVQTLSANNSALLPDHLSSEQVNFLKKTSEIVQNPQKKLPFEDVFALSHLLNNPNGLSIKQQREYLRP